MKKFLWSLVIIITCWLGYTKWVNQGFPYPWECFATEVNVEESLAWKSSSNSWDNFRLNFPYHIQTIGVSDFEQDGSRIILISEPPNHFTEAGVLTIFNHFNTKSEIKTHEIGYDGWVKDYLIVTTGGSERQMKIAIDELNKYVFQSDYRPHYLELSKSQAPDLNCGDNYSITAAEINNWFIEGEDKLFVSSRDENSIESIANLINSNQFGVYYSRNPGFVAWVIPKGSIDGYRKDARRFTLDADIIVGGICGTYSIAIIGRERTTDVFALPPLRVETILQLAAADKQQISQSYERMNMFAGKIPGGKDWAPIYLSDDLINTEYGSLLNITDQMLKGWSQHGEITYHNFMYPKPINYPYPHPVMEEINTSTLTFNWNTKGAAYIVNYNDFDIVALNRTGSLPVTYIPEGIDKSQIPFNKVRECEDKFYDFFSSLKDPNLVRVVQYAAIYQMFSAYNVTADGQQNIAVKPERDVSTEYSNKLLTAIMFYNTNTKNPFAGIFSNYQAGSDAYNNALSTAFAKLDLDPAIDAVKSKISELGLVGEGRKILSFVIGHPRLDREFSYNSSMISEEGISEIMDWYSTKTENFQIINQYIDLLGISRKEVMDEYVKSFSDSHQDWIKTPSIVISWSKDSSFSVGGHNIDSRMLGLRVDKSLASGQVKVIEENGVRRLMIAADDVSHITPGMIREIETKNLIGMQQIDGKLLGGTVRNRGTVFTAPGKSGRGFTPHQTKYTTIVKEEIEIANNGVPYLKYNIKGQEFVGETHSPFVVFPKSKITEIDKITSSMKNRKIADGEFKVLSFVDDASTNSTLENYCHGNFIKRNIYSIDDLKMVFFRNEKKTFNLIGHLEDGCIVSRETGVRLRLADIQIAAEEANVNYMIVGCESAFEQGAGVAGFAHKINSVEAARALGMALENSKDVYTFTHTLAKNSRLQFIVYEVPMKDLGYSASLLTQSETVVAIIGGTVVAAGTATGIIISVSDNNINEDDNKNKENSDDGYISQN